MSVEEPLLEVDDIQGHLLTGFGRAYEMLLGIRFKPEDVVNAKAALRIVAADVTPGRASAADKARRRMVALAGGVPTAEAQLSVAMAFSKAGIAKLGEDPSRIVDPIFQMGAARSAAAIGDEIDANGMPASWQFGSTPETEPDVLLIIASADQAEVISTTGHYVAMLGESCTIVLRECGRRIERDAEHFGFVDGVSQPGIRGRVDPDTYLTPRAYPAGHPQARMWARPGQLLTWPGQFIFGYPGLDPDAQQQPGAIVGEGESLLMNGSLLVIRRLSQDVGLFWRAMANLANQLTASTGTEWTSERAASRCVGRWRDGTPVSLSPDKEVDEISGKFYRLNGFRFLTPIAAVTLNDKNGDYEFPGAGADPTGKNLPVFWTHPQGQSARPEP
ncbi:hypothetical protein SAMN03159304_03115 [Pseudomonas sp. NFACC24-1]|uniref:hypothetical protein n=1 Tax=Pseudomonas sp. NFACC24-1 TaxID=1566189 RepID=UPI0008ED420E|nr:hypothetical protein [Pseudomonas sp. NFACC24-1]SFO39774.1 hypothetical protein SAMN03159304_03115 [Pseudomonas sp. NFACC24-1]